ncbi:MAG TPA: primosomal protein N' [Solirubrobacteraceae bacterium]|jgi:primosomal protein N' (replication factor Y)|nr:primosomal protein N' [Solirubrobacteraceae bacterium]
MSAIAQVEPLTTARALRGPFDYRLPEELCGGIVGVGSMLVVPFARRQVLGVVVGMSEHSEIAEEKLLVPLRALELGVPVELVALAEWIAAEYCSTIARALTLVLAPGAARRLSGRKRRKVVRTERLPVGARRPQPPPLTPAQGQALRSLQDALGAQRFEQTLLQGVTGSGKTEVYLRAAAGALEQGRGAIVLVPEIALTPQIVGRFSERFGETVAVLHSRLRGGERYEEWRRLRTGEARVCVGPRSAVFAPVERLGLIVVDEEHDASYKHEGDPRYDAREVAVRRARAAGALLVLGSATPRPESLYRAGLPGRPSQTGALLRLPERVDGRPLPRVDVLDMRGESNTGLHPVTVQALARVREDRGKAIVLLNRRGWSNFLSCRSCGRVWSCPECDVALVLHRRDGFLACHHCGHRESAPARCEQCGSISVGRHGAGTERVQHDLTAALDGNDERFPVLRLDADTVGSDGVATLLRRFEAAESGVLIGTQMVAKGHDFPDVTLGVVLDADATLRFPDFRAEERTFALIAQLAGRVGRGAEGRVLVQTIAPEARAIAYASRHDSDGFLAGELERREALRYPPFSHLIRIVCSAVESPPARAAATALAERLNGSLAVGSGTAVRTVAGQAGQEDARERRFGAPIEDRRDLRSGAHSPDGWVPRAGRNGDASRRRVSPGFAKDADRSEIGQRRSAAVLGPAALFRLRGQERQVLVVKASERRSAVRAVGEAVRLLAEDRAHRGVSFSVDVDPQ